MGAEARVRQSHLILSNAVIMWVARVLLLIPQLILVPFLIHRIGDVGYGVYVLAWSLMLSIDLLQNSLQQGVVKYSAAFLAEKRLDDVNRVVSSSFIYSILLAVLACAAILIVAIIGSNQSREIFPLLVIAVMVLLMVPLTPYIAIIQSRQRYYVGAIAETVSKYIGLLAVVVWFDRVGPSVEALIVISAGLMFLSRFAQVPIAYRMVRGLRNNRRLFDAKSFRLIASFGAATVLIALCITANTTGIRWMMGILESPSFVAHLAIILMPGLLLSQVIQAMTITVMPATSAYKATGNQRMLQELLIRGMRYTTILVLAGMIAAGLLMRNVLAVWLGPEYVFLAPYAFVLFAGMSFMHTTATIHHMLKGLGRLRITVFISLMGLVIVPIVVILAVFQTWHNPYIAVTAGLAAGNVVYGAMQIVFGSKAVHADLRAVFMRVYAQPLIVAAVVSVIALGVVAPSGIDGLVGRAGVSLLALLLFFSGCYGFIATAAERQQVRELIQTIAEKMAVIHWMRPKAKQS